MLNMIATIIYCNCLAGASSSIVLTCSCSFIVWGCITEKREWEKGHVYFPLQTKIRLGPPNAQPHPIRARLLFESCSFIGHVCLHIWCSKNPNKVEETEEKFGQQPCLLVILSSTASSLPTKVSSNFVVAAIINITTTLVVFYMCFLADQSVSQ